MIQLRNLEEKDASFMLEWMHDPQIQKCFQKNMMGMSLNDAKEFCRKSTLNQLTEENRDLHFAIVDESDEYLGTISLENVDRSNKSAVYAISTRTCIQGTGAAREATKLLLTKGFRELGLHRIYLNVLSDNGRAIRFYEKCGFVYEGESRDHVCLEGKWKSLKWYGMLETEFDKMEF